MQYYRAGDWERLERYCLEDVKLTRDLYEYARKHGQLLFQKGPRRAPVPMSFAESPFAPLLREVGRERSSVQLVYGSKTRLVDVTMSDHAVEGQPGLLVTGRVRYAIDGLPSRYDKLTLLLVGVDDGSVVVAATLVWTAALLVTSARARIPAYDVDLPGPARTTDGPPSGPASGSTSGGESRARQVGAA